MRILFVSPEFEEQGRGITGIIKAMVRAAKDAGHEVGVLAGYPNVDFKDSQLLDEKVEHIYLQHYLRTGKKDIFPHGLRGKKTQVKIILGRKYLSHSLYHVNQDLITDKTNMAKKIDFVVKIPYCYQFINHGMSRVSIPVLKKAIKKYKIDLVVTGSPMDISRADITPARLAQFVHDTMPLDLLETPADNDTPRRFAQQLHAAAQYSDIVFTNSEDTKHKVLEVNPGANVKVVYGTASSIPEKVAESEILHHYSLEKDKFLLFVSVIEKRKNLNTLFDAYSRIHDKLGMPLVIVGAKGYGHEDIMKHYKLLSSDVRKDIIFTGFISEADKYTLFKNANSFTFPSLYEGIGLPIIEAFSCGLPVLTTHRGALPEAGGDAAYYINDPYDSIEVGEGILRVATDNELREKLRQNMPKQVEKFSSQAFTDRFTAGIKSLE